MSDFIEPDPVSLQRFGIHWLTRISANYGIQIDSSRDFEEFARLRSELRSEDSAGSEVSPYWDPRFNGRELEQGAFWVHGTHKGRSVFLDAYRSYHVEGDFQRWVLDWLMSVHNRSGERVDIVRPQKQASAVARSVAGKVVYRGEFWICPSLRCNGRNEMIDDLSRMTMTLCWIAHKPDFVFGLTVRDKARAGIMNRVQFDYTEPDFVVWKKGKRPRCVETHREMLVLTTAEGLLSHITPDYMSLKMS